MQDPKRVPGENQMQRLLRLLQIFQAEIKLLEGEVNISLNCEGSGALYADQTLIYRFSNTTELINFLEAGQLARLALRGGSY
jgi:hypothetical protein